MRGSSTNDHWWQQYGHAAVPSDVLVVLGWLALANGLLYAQLLDSVFVRALVGLPFLFVLPGYALVALLFPGRELATTITEQSGESASPYARAGGGYVGTRLALALGASLAILPLFALLLSGAGFEYTPWVVVTGLSAFVLVAMVGAIIRRARLPADERFRLPVGEWIAAADRAVFGTRSTVDTVLNVALAVVVLASVAGVGYAVVAPTGEESFTSVTLLTENEDGELVAANYSDEFDPAGEELVLRIENDEGEDVTYGVVGELQEASASGSSVDVQDRTEQLRTTETVGDGEAVTLEHTVEPERTGDDLRLIYYVYRGEAPEEPTRESAYRTVHVWIDVPSES